MPVVSNYTGLQQAVLGHLQNFDIEQDISMFIQFAEADFNRTLRVPDMLKRVTTTMTASSVPVPTDYLAMYHLRISQSTPREDYKFVAPDVFRQLQADVPVGQTRVYTISNGQIDTLPDATGLVLEMLYYQTIPALASNSTNWLLITHPDLYLYNTLLQAAPYLGNDERVALWKGWRDSIIDELMTAGKERPQAALNARRVRAY
jgi:hypothetical protein